MQHVIDLNCSLSAKQTSLSPTALIWQDILAQAMTGELVAALNYTALSQICDDPAEAADALEHAEGEQGHAALCTSRAAQCAQPRTIAGARRRAEVHWS